MSSGSGARDHGVSTQILRSGFPTERTDRIRSRPVLIFQISECAFFSPYCTNSTNNRKNVVVLSVLYTLIVLVHIKDGGNIIYYPGGATRREEYKKRL